MVKQLTPIITSLKRTYTASFMVGSVMKIKQGINCIITLMAKNMINKTPVRTID